MTDDTTPTKVPCPYCGSMGEHSLDTNDEGETVVVCPQDDPSDRINNTLLNQTIVDVQHPDPNSPTVIATLSNGTRSLITLPYSATAKVNP